MAAPAGLEPASAGVKVLCLTSLATRLYCDAPTYGRNLIPIRFGASVLTTVPTNSQTDDWNGYPFQKYVVTDALYGGTGSSESVFWT